MPMSDSNYVAPTWVNNAPPALDAAELQAMCNTIAENQSGLASAISSLTSAINGRAQVKIVSYVGTGTYGARNPCSITSDFPIQLAIGLGYSNGAWTSLFNLGGNPTMDSASLTTSYAQYFGFYGSNSPYLTYGKKSSDNKTFSWYGNNAKDQLNASGNRYYIFLIG